MMESKEFERQHEKAVERELEEIEKEKDKEE